MLLLLKNFILTILLPGEIACIEELKLTQALFDVISYMQRPTVTKDTLIIQDYVTYCNSSEPVGSVSSSSRQHLWFWSSSRLVSWRSALLQVFIEEVINLPENHQDLRNTTGYRLLM